MADGSQTMPSARLVRWSLRVAGRIVAGADVEIPPVLTAADAYNAAAVVGDAVERTLLAQAGLWREEDGLHRQDAAEVNWTAFERDLRDQVLRELDERRRRTDTGDRP